MLCFLKNTSSVGKSNNFNHQKRKFFGILSTCFLCIHQKHVRIEFLKGVSWQIRHQDENKPRIWCSSKRCADALWTYSTLLTEFDNLRQVASFWKTIFAPIVGTIVGCWSLRVVCENFEFRVSIARRKSGGSKNKRANKNFVSWTNDLWRWARS